MLRNLPIGLCCASLLALTACMPKMTAAELAAHMPEGDPAAAARLKMFAGEWEMEGKADMAMLSDGPLESSGTSVGTWDEQAGILTSRGTFTLGELGSMTGVEAWTYDAENNVYRSTWIDSMGGVGMGEGTYDEATRTWHMKATGNGPHGKSTMEGSVTFTDDDHNVWTWAEYMGLTKTMEMSGTGQRK